MIKVKGLKEIHFDKKQFLKGVESDIRKMLNDSIARAKNQTMYFADRTGDLRKSPKIVRVKRKSFGFGDMVGTFGSKTSYSGFIHEGTKKITARPWMLDAALDRVEDLEIALADTAVKSLIHKGTGK